MDKYRTISAVCQGAGLLSGYDKLIDNQQISAVKTQLKCFPYLTSMHNGAENTRIRAMNVIQLVSKERVRSCVFYHSETLLAYYKILVLDSCNNSRKSRKSKC